MLMAPCTARKKNTKDKALRGYEENNFVVAENIRQRLLKAETNQWDELYEELEQRATQVWKQEEEFSPSEETPAEAKERKWKDVSKKIVKTNVRAVKNVMMDKTVMPEEQKTKEQVDTLVNSQAPQEEKAEISESNCSFVHPDPRN